MLQLKDMERFTTNPNRNLSELNFSEQLNEILNTPLTPENMETYASDALSKLIDLSDEIIDAFNRKSATSFANDSELENAAFVHFGLPDIDNNLNFIAKQQDIIDQTLARVTSAKANSNNKTLLPPDENITNIESGDGSFNNDFELIPRTATLIYLLQNQFSLDINDPEQFQIEHGSISTDMMREESYSVILANLTKQAVDDDSADEAQISRLIFVCDAPRNATFVIDADIARDLIGDDFADDLASLTKSQLKDLLAENPTLGKNVNYHKGETWPNRILQAINHPEKEIKDTKEKLRLLANDIEPAKEGEISLNGFRNKYDSVSVVTLKKIVEKAGLEPIGKRRIRGQITDVYNEQQLIYLVSEYRLAKNKPLIQINDAKICTSALGYEIKKKTEE